MADINESGGETVEAAARDYAWKWFEYHAGQRQAVFRFFLLLSGATMTGYVTSHTNAELTKFSYLFGIALVLISFLFWRLDVRSLKLVKLSEAFLKVEEERMARCLKNETIKFATKADIERPTNPLVRQISSFRQIYALIFVLIALLGALIFCLDQGSPIVGWINRCF